MSNTDIQFIIDTLEAAIEWSSYTDEYFAKKHNLANDKENVVKAIRILMKELDA